MEKIFDKYLLDITKWEELESMYDTSQEGNSSHNNRRRPEQTVETLQRSSISLHGVHPKMEYRIYSHCCVCEQVFNPQKVGVHKECCPGRGKIQSQNLKKKVKSKKKQQNSPVPLPPLFKKETSGSPVLPQYNESSSVSSDIITTSPSVNLDVVVSTPKLINENSEITIGPGSPSSSSSQSNLLTDEETNNKLKKSKKNNIKIYKEYDPDVHCGVIEGQKGPCTRSITCSNHKLQLRKSVPGRSKDINILISEKRAAKDKELRRRSPTRSETIKTNSINHLIVDVDQTTLITTSTPTITTTTIITTSTVTTTSTTSRTSSVNMNKNDLHDDNEIDDNSNQLESGYCSIETTVSSTKSSPIIYYNPISPIFVVTPIQFVQKENNVCVETPQSALSPSLPNGSYFLTIPEQTSNIKYYKSHPKPTVLPTYGARKIGGSILCSSQRLEYQRNDIQMAITTKRRPSSSNNCKQTTNTTYNITTSPRTILLKTKNLGKVNCKRTSTDKLGGSDNKQIRLGTEVNGFILHADMSEVADAPHTCIQENINLLNMK